MPNFLKLLEIGIYLMLYREYEADEWVSKFMPGRRARIEQGTPYIDMDFEVVYNKSLS